MGVCLRAVQSKAWAWLASTPTGTGLLFKTKLAVAAGQEEKEVTRMLLESMMVRTLAAAGKERWGAMWLRRQARQRMQGT